MYVTLRRYTSQREKETNDPSSLVLRVDRNTCPNVPYDTRPGWWEGVEKDVNEKVNNFEMGTHTMSTRVVGRI